MAYVGIGQKGEILTSVSSDKTPTFLPVPLINRISSAVTDVDAADSELSSNITSIEIPEGTWDIDAMATAMSDGNHLSNMTVGISDVSETFTGNLGDSYSSINLIGNFFSELSGFVLSFRVVLLEPTFYYFVGKLEYNTGTPKWFGRITAIKIND